MSGNYSHNTILNGTVLADTRYNADHQNHIDNHTPAGLDDYSANVAQMQSVADPGDVGSELLATSTAGEFERYRFVIKRFLGTDHWYRASVARTALAVLMGASSTLVSAFPNAEVSFFRFMWVVPASYQSGNATLHILIDCSGDTGLVVMDVSTARYRSGAAPVVIASNTAVNPTISNANSLLITFAIPAAQFTTGDLLAWSVRRDATHASDTVEASVTLNGVWIGYTGYPGRS